MDQESNHEPIRLLRVEHVMERLALSKSAVYELMASGQLKSVRIGRSRRVSERAIDDFIASLSSDTTS
jgi:excisionase family DNA binding protein